MVKRIVCDTGPLISLADSCLIRIIGQLAKQNNLKLIIPQSVKKEAITKPLNIKRFELSALRIKDSLEDGWVEVWSNDRQVNSLIPRIKNTANRLFKADGDFIEIMHEGEAEVLALAKKLNSELLLMDERTTRLLIEDPEGLKRFMSYKYGGQKVSLNQKALKEFKKIVPPIKVIRSIELLVLAFEKGLFEGELLQNKQALEAALYAVKYNGCAVSLSEIKDFLKTVKD